MITDMMKLEEQETPATPPSPPHYMYVCASLTKLLSTKAQTMK